MGKFLGTKIFLIIVLLNSCKTQKDSAYYRAKSDELWFKEKYKNAYKLMVKAIALDPKNDTLYVRAAYCYRHAYMKHRNEKSYDETVRGLYNKSLGLNPWNNYAVLDRAEYDFFNKRYGLVLRYMDSLLVRDRKNIDAYLYKAKVFSSSGSYSDSAKYFQNFNAGLKNIDEKDKPRLYYNIVSNYLSAKNWEMAKYYELKSIAIKKEKNTNSLAVCYYKLGQMDSACYYFNEKECSGYPCGLYNDSIKIKCKDYKDFPRFYKREISEQK